MDSKELRELIEIISRSTFTSFELEREGLKLKLVKGGNSVQHAPAPLPPLVARPAAAPAVEAAALPPAQASPAPPEDGTVVLHSPIVGTFYRSASPEAAPFVTVGSQVKKGQVLCIVEAMKLMNEIESETDAEVVEILVENGQPVEFGEVLFRLRPLR